VDYITPAEVAATMVETGRRKLALPIYDLFIRGALAGAILGVATSLAFTGVVSTGQPLVGALIFPVGLIIIVLLALELVTGSFALLPLPWLDGDASATAVVTRRDDRPAAATPTVTAISARDRTAPMATIVLIWGTGSLGSAFKFQSVP